MIHIGIDPGQKGGLAAVDGDGSLISVRKLVVIQSGKLKWIDGNWLYSALLDIQIHAPQGQARCVVERAQFMPKQGGSSSFNYGVGFGSLLSIIQARGLPLEFVQAAKWKRVLGVTSDKATAIDRARLLYPDADDFSPLTDGKAEALLIAHYSLRHMGVS